MLELCGWFVIVGGGVVLVVSYEVKVCGVCMVMGGC